MRSCARFSLFFIGLFCLLSFLPAFCWAEDVEDLSALTTEQLLMRLQTNSDQMKELLQTQQIQLQESQTQLQQALKDLDLSRLQLNQAQLQSQTLETQLLDLKNSLKTTTESFQNYRAVSEKTISFLNARITILTVGIVTVALVGTAAVIALVMAP